MATKVFIKVDHSKPGYVCILCKDEWNEHVWKKNKGNSYETTWYGIILCEFGSDFIDFVTDFYTKMQPVLIVILIVVLPIIHSIFLNVENSFIREISIVLYIPPIRDKKNHLEVVRVYGYGHNSKRCPYEHENMYTINILSSISTEWV